MSAHQDSNSDLDRILAIAGIGCWRFDVGCDQIVWSDEQYRIFGLPVGMPVCYETFLAMVHGMDRDYVDHCWQNALDGRPFDIEHRIVVGDEVRWVHVRAELEFDATGAFAGAVGSCQDITEYKELEDELQMSRLALIAALDVADMATWGWDNVARVKLWNAKTKALFGVASDREMTRELFLTLLHPDDRETFEVAWAAALDPAGNRTFSLEYRIRRLKDGGERWISSRGTVEFRGDRPVRVMGAMRDITEEKRAQLARQRSEERFRSVFERSHTAIAILSGGGRFEQCNEAFCDLVGRSEDELRRLDHFTLLVHPDDRLRERAKVDGVRKGVTDGCETELRYLRRDGHEVWVSEAISALRGEVDQADEVLVTAVDVTAHRRAEQEAIADRNRIRSIADRAPVMFARIGRDLQFRFANEGYAHRFDMQPQQIVGSYVWEVFGQDLFDEVSPQIQQALAGESVEFDVGFENAAGQQRYMHIHYAPERDANGTVDSFFVAATDVTDLKLAEDRMRTFIEEAPVAIAMFDRDMRYLGASRRWNDYFSPEITEVVGRSLYEVFPEIGERWKEVHRRGLAGEVLWADDDRFERLDGRVQYLRWEVRPWHNADGAIGGITIMSEDVTGKVVSEQALRIGEERLRLALQGAGGGAWDYDLQNMTSWWSPELHELWGVSPDTVLDLANALEPVYAEDRQALMEAVEHAIATRSTYQHEFRVRHPRLGERWMISFGRVVSNAAGEAERMVGLAFDVTERKRQQLLIEQLNLRLASHNEDLGRFNDIVSHDLDKPLRHMILLAQRIDQEIGNQAFVEQSRENARHIVGKAQALQGMLAELLAFAKIGRERCVPEAVDVGVLLAEIVQLLAPDESVRISIGEGMPVLQAVPAMLRLVLYNLIDNAIKHNDKAEGRIDIRVRDDADAYVFTVEDNGTGIDPEYFGRIFQPFRKIEDGRNLPGHGMGLALVRRALDSIGGSVEVADKGAGRGAVFTVRWPKQMAATMV